MISDEEDSSGSDVDDAFRNDMEALKRACLLAGTNPSDLQLVPAGDATVSGGGGSKGDSDSDDDEDDLQFVRNIQKRFDIFNDFEKPMPAFKPICSMPPVGGEDSEDDFETLRAIQRRFAAYDDDRLKGSIGNAVLDSEQVGVTTIASEKETSNNFFVESSNAWEGFPNCVDKSSSSTKSLEAWNKNVEGSWPSQFLDLHKSRDDGATVEHVKGSDFPKSAQAFVEAIKKNRSCQQLIRNKLMHIEARMEEIKMLKDRVKILKDFQVSCKMRTARALSMKKDAHVQLISAMKPRTHSKVNEKLSAMNYGPAENSQVANYREALKRFPVSISREKWLDKEKENLAKGVRQQIQEMLLQRSLDLVSNVDGSLEENANLDSIVSSIRDLDITPENMRAFVPMVNWDHLASMYLRNRSGAECQARWLNCEDPLINNNPWSTAEDKNLLRVVQQKGLCNWIDIAVSLGTNRTPFQCLARYQRSLNASIIKREWTKEEDNQLRAAVEAFGESNWQAVASSMEGRTGTQCSNRWIKSLHPARAKVGRWTSEEDKRLQVAVMLFGPKSWKKVAGFIPGRTHVQCRERWVNSLDPSLNLNKWSAEEDLKLKEAIQEHGYCWSKVAACVPARTDNQCLRRWKVLFPHEVPLLRAARGLQRAALISNFVDRESERSCLGPGDFALPPSSDLCIEEVPRLTNGIEVENSTCKKRRKGPSRKKPDTVNTMCTSNEKELEISGASNLEAEKDYLPEGKVLSRRMPQLKGTYSQFAVTSKRKRKLQSSTSGGPETEASLPAVIDPSLSLVTNGEEGISIEDASCHQRVSKLHPRRRRCLERREKAGVSGNTDCLLPLGDPSLLIATEGNDVIDVARNGEAAMRIPNGFGKPREVPELSPSNPAERNVGSKIGRKKRQEALDTEKNGIIDARNNSLSRKSLKRTVEVEECFGNETKRIKRNANTICPRSGGVPSASGIESYLAEGNLKPSEEWNNSCSSPTRLSGCGILGNGDPECSYSQEYKKLRRAGAREFLNRLMQEEDDTNVTPILQKPRSQAREFLNRLLQEENHINVAPILQQPSEFKSLPSSIELDHVPLTNNRGSSESSETPPLTDGGDTCRLKACSNGEQTINPCTEESRG